MPKFKTLPLSEAMVKSATGKRAQLTKEYMEYIEQLPSGQAGQLEASDGESIAAVRRRLGAASRVAGKDLVIKRVGEELFFWALLLGSSRWQRSHQTTSGKACQVSPVTQETHTGQSCQVDYSKAGLKGVRVRRRR